VEELQAAFDAMRWTYQWTALGFAVTSPVTVSRGDETAYFSNGYDAAGVSAAYAASVSSYSTSTFTWGDHLAYRALYANGPFLNTYQCTLIRASRDIEYSNIPNHLAHSADAFYFFETCFTPSPTVTAPV